MHASAARLERGVEAGRRRAGDAQDAVARARSRRRGQHATSPSTPRTATIDSSRSNGTNASRMQRHAAELRPTRRRRRPRARSTRLALAVVAAAPRLQHRRAARARRPRRRGRRAIVDRAERRGRDRRARGAVCLLDEPVLRRPRARARPGAPARSPPSARAVAGGHAFPLVGDDRRARRRAVEPRRRRRAPPTTRSPTAAAGASGDGIEEPEREAERDAGQPEHPPELAAAQHRHLRHGGDTLPSGASRQPTLSFERVAA